MTEEFITVYIEKMKATLIDLQTRVLFLETDSHFKTKAIEELNIENEKLRISLDKAGKKSVAKKTEEGF
jgi:hypothetical protein